MTRKVLLIEPFYGGSHRAWADGYQHHSHHSIHLLTLPAQFWKWRMQGGAVTLARLVAELDFQPDVILVSDMVNLATFRLLTRDQTAAIPTALYFHESQLTYPQNRRQRHGWRYGFVNYISALAADAVYYNSAYHLKVFFAELPRMLKHFGDFNELQTIDELRQKASVLPLGVDLQRFDPHKVIHPSTNEPPLIIWNHRWEADKKPTVFINALYALMEQGVPFRVALVGENFRQEPVEFEEARERLGERIIQYGYMEHFPDYARLLWQADYVVSTAYQDFFGVAIAEGIHCGCVPLLPRRLNYPNLIPVAYHGQCLFQGDELLPLLKRHLTGEIIVDAAPLQKNIAQYDWATLVQDYDNELSRLAVAH